MNSSVPNRRVSCGAFTLIELMVVVAIIAILAGLTLSTMGYMNRKAARSRAEAEVAALAAAIESYKLDNGLYPQMDNPSSTSMANVTTTNLYAALCPTGAGKVYLEPRPSMLNTNSTRYSFIDPWGNAYNYRTNTNGNILVNSNFFDVWSTAGSTNTDDYIRN
ncbi:MAG: prepilin-type N-terminal cleavage/methylation domain-containing protein [Chthoniobacterales bacterium]|nr:prepilin-type N-terminal cleavage/methylation domain-containing protein [Chthoniobacterales bacterium]